MRNTDIYLHFGGNSEKAFLFYKTVFGGEFITVQRYGEVPGGDKMSADDREKMMHISLKLSPNTVLMASDNLDKGQGDLVQGNNFHICLQAETENEADKLFNQLSDNGKIEMPMNKTFWGAYFGMCRDQFGILWMINYSLPQNN